MLSAAAWSILRCPACAGELTRDGDQAARCTSCRAPYPLGPRGQVDLRPRAAVRATLELDVAPTAELAIEFAPLTPNPRPQIDWRGVALPPRLTEGNRLTPELLSHFPRAAPGSGAFMLDLGCADRAFADVCARTNFEYVGMDHQGDAPDVLGDAHALPFKDEAFGFILCVAVLEHLRHPVLAMREAFRVLRPGAPLIGTVAFLEPFHMDSYYHHSFLGTYHTLASAGFDVRQVAPNLRWTALQALANMNLFYGLPRRATDLLVLPLRALNRLWWTYEDVRYQTRGSWETWRQLSTTGGYYFVAAKPAPAG